MCIRIFCNQCQRETNHSVRHCLNNDRNDGTGQAPRVVREEWRLLQCKGCDSIQVYMAEESPNCKSPRCVSYPPRQSRRLPQWRALLSVEIQGLYSEIYVALAADCLTLAVIGARTLVDTVLAEKVGDGNFREKLDGAVANGFLTKKAAEIIAAAIEIGHAASHRGYAPTQQQVFDVLDIVEHSLLAPYVLQDKSKQLIASVPPRGARK